MNATTIYIGGGLAGMAAETLKQKDVLCLYDHSKSPDNVTILKKDAKAANNILSMLSIPFKEC